MRRQWLALSVWSSIPNRVSSVLLLQIQKDACQPVICSHMQFYVLHRTKSAVERQSHACGAAPRQVALLLRPHLQ